MNVASISNPEVIVGLKSHLKQLVGFGKMTVESIRAGEEGALAALPKMEGVIVEELTIGSLHGEWVRACNDEAAHDGAVLYFHGGAFISGSCRTHRDLAARISKASGAPVLVVEYRLAPEHPYPAANEDCLQAYQWLLEQGYSGSQVMLGGDSVGGTLVLMTLLAIRDSGLPSPAGAFLMSPHTDFIRFDSESYVTRAELDPTGSLASSRLCADYYAGSLQPRPSILSPLSCELEDLPPLLLQVGEHEVLYDECVQFAHRAEVAGVPVVLEVWEDMWCVFQQLAAILPEGQSAIEHIGAFVNSRLAAGQHAKQQV